MPLSFKKFLKRGFSGFLAIFLLILGWAIFMARMTYRKFLQILGGIIGFIGFIMICYFAWGRL